MSAMRASRNPSRWNTCLAASTRRALVRTPFADRGGFGASIAETASLRSPTVCPLTAYGRAALAPLAALTHCLCAHGLRPRPSGPARFAHPLAAPHGHPRYPPPLGRDARARLSTDG